MSSSVAPIEEPYGDALGTVMAFRDVTLRREKERQRIADCNAREDALEEKMERLRLLTVTREARMFEMKKELAGLIARLGKGGHA